MRTLIAFLVVSFVGLLVGCARGNESLAALNTTLCEIVVSPSSFNHKVVRFRASAQSDPEHAILIDSGCPASGIALHWDSAYRSHSVKLLAGALYPTPAGSRGSEIAGTFTGRFIWNPSGRPARALKLMHVDDLTIRLEKP